MDSPLHSADPGRYRGDFVGCPQTQRAHFPLPRKKYLVILPKNRFLLAEKPEHCIEPGDLLDKAGVQPLK